MLILTDGAIDDLEDSINEIVRASDLPLSIVIVGIGKLKKDEIEKMNKLDADDEPLYSNKLKKSQTRDTV